jgi:hypothetical protein
MGPTPASAVVPPHDHSTSTPAQPADTTPDWLQELNVVRHSPGLAPVTENPAWKDALLKHLNYLNKTSYDLRTGQYESWHTENPASPYYTPEGAAAGGSSNLIGGSSTEAWRDIDAWLTGPYHAFPMLLPQLVQAEYARDGYYAGLSLGQGFDWTIENPPGPVLFPGPGLTLPMSYVGNEDPDPLLPCGWEYPDAIPGLPLFVLTTVEPTDGTTATITADDGPDYSTAAGTICLLDTDKKLNPAEVRPLDSGGYYQLILIPKTMLTASRYHVTVNMPGQAPITWSFIVDHSDDYNSTLMRRLVLHVSDGSATTVLGNLTVTDPLFAGFTTAYPCLDGRPTASNNNFVANQTIPNFVAVHPDANGDICIYSSQLTDLIWDQVAETSAFSTHNAVRVLDTRSGSRPAAGSTTKVHVTDSGAQTVLGNLTVTAPSGAGFTTVYPCLDGRPTASNNNYVKGQTIPNFVAAHPDANGDICIYTSASTQLIWDQVGETDAFASHTATRLLDTRTGSKPGNGAVVQVHVTDSGAQTVLGNLTVTAPTAAGFTTVYPCLDGRPTASNNNYVKGQTIPNFVAAHPDANGDICIYTNISAHLIWDQVAETSSFTAHNANRIWDTRSPRAYSLS